jgi:holo-[acyl-carrier protein] synthase
MKVIGIGTEIIECVRIAKMIERHGEMFLERVYTPAEVSYCSARSSATQHFAARWAAKEAVLKAIAGRSRGIRWNEIEVVVEQTVAPSIRLRGRAEDWATQIGVEQFQLSLGNCRTHATAFVIAMKVS